MNRQVTLGQFIGILLTLAISFFGWGYSLGNRMLANEANDNQRDKRIEIHENRMDKMSDKIDAYFIQMNEKCDKILYEIKHDSSK